MTGSGDNALRSNGTGERAASLGSVSASDLRAWLPSGETLLVDIREAEEHARHSLPGAVSVPLSEYPRLLETADGIKRVVFHCQTGTRTRLAAGRLTGSTSLPTYALDGGVAGWDRASEGAGAVSLRADAAPNAIPWPPLLYGAAGLAAVLMGRLAPLGGSLPDGARIVGACVMLAGAATDAAAMLAMRRHRANIWPHRAATALVTSGPFSASRNPIYLGNTAMLAGASLAFENAWFAPAAAMAAFAVTKLAIQREERHLAALFGPAWHDYAARVPRWLGRRC